MITLHRPRHTRRVPQTRSRFAELVCEVSLLGWRARQAPILRVLRSAPCSVVLYRASTVHRARLHAYASTSIRPNPTLSCTLHMGDTVKPPDGFDPACFRLLNKTAELVSKTSLTSLTVFCRQQDTVSLLRVSTSSDRYSEASSCNFLPPAAGTAIPSQSTSQVQFHPFTPADSTCLCV